MNSINSGDNRPTLELLMETIDRVSSKLSRLQDEVRAIQSERNGMEVKIAEAQTRIHKILSKLPNQEDTRQLNLLDGAGESHE